MSSSPGQDTEYDPALEHFLEYTYEEYEKFLAQLKENRTFTFAEDEENRHISCRLPKNANGLYLLKVFCAMVRHPWYNQGNKCTYGTEGERGVKKKQDEREYLTVEIFVPLARKVRDHIIKIDCNSSNRQPGNGEIVGYGKYDTDYTGWIDWAQFTDYFDPFLCEKWEPPYYPTRQPSMWKLSVLLIFEIARRVHSRDVYHHLPVAVGIQMVMEMENDEGDIFKLFKTSNRFDSFRAVAQRYLEKKNITDRSPKTREVRKLSDDLLKKYKKTICDWPESNNVQKTKEQKILDMLWSENDEFKDELCVRAKAEKVKIEVRGQKPPTYTAIVSAGDQSIRVFRKCLSHYMFLPSNSVKEVGEDKCVRYKISFPKADETITIFCNARENNRQLFTTKGLLSRKELLECDVQNFSEYFKKFLTEIRTEEGKESNVKFQMSVRLALKIARRLHGKDEHSDLPVAAAIQMAMILELKPDKIFDVFSGNTEERMEAFEKIVWEYFEKKPLTDGEDIRTRVKGLFNVFL